MTGTRRTEEYTHPTLIIALSPPFSSTGKDRTVTDSRSRKLVGLVSEDWSRSGWGRGLRRLYPIRRKKQLFFSLNLWTGFQPARQAGWKPAARSRLIGRGA